MAFKAILLCASALFVQTISGQCMRNAPIAAEGYGYGLGGVGLAGADGYGYGLGGVGIAGADGYGYGLGGIGLAGPGLARPGLAGVGLAADGIGLAGAGRAWNAGYGGAAIGGRLGDDLAFPTNGGGFTVTSVSPIAPAGLSVVSENAIEGILAVTGQLPFLSVVALDGALPTAGSGGVSCSCGNGNIAIESVLGADIGYANGVGLGADGVGYGPAGLGYGTAGLGYGAAGYGLGAADLRVGAPAIGLGVDVGPARGCGYGRALY